MEKKRQEDLRVAYEREQDILNNKYVFFFLIHNRNWEIMVTERLNIILSVTTLDLF